MVLREAKRPLWWSHLNVRELIFGRSNPLEICHFTDSYSKSSYLADQVADLPLVDLPFHRFVLLRAHIWLTRWQIYPPNGDFADSCSDSSYDADQVLTDLPPYQMSISQIPALTAHLRQTSSWQIYPLSWTAVSQIPALTAHMRQTRSWQIYPPIKWQFHRFLLWQLIWGRPGLGRSTPQSNGRSTPSLLQASGGQEWY